MCSRGDAVFEAEDVAGAAAAVAAAGAGGAVTSFVAPGLRVDSIFNTDDEGAAAGRGEGDGPKGDHDRASHSSTRSRKRGWSLEYVDLE